MTAIPQVPFLSVIEKIPELLNKDELNSVPNSFTLNIFHIIIGSKVGKWDFENASLNRNHEAPAVIINLHNTPIKQLTPSIIEMLARSNYKKLIIQQFAFLIDPEYVLNPTLNGLVSVYPLFNTMSFIVENGNIRTSDINPSSELADEPIINFTSILKPIVIPENVNELQINAIVRKILSYSQSAHSDSGTGNLINIMDCTSHTMRRTWIDNNDTRVYIAMPNCLFSDTNPQYMPVITFSHFGEHTIRWCNWRFDKDLIPTYRIISPITYQFLIVNYWREIIEVFMVGYIKFASRMNVTQTYTIIHKNEDFVNSTFPLLASYSSDQVIAYRDMNFELLIELWKMRCFQIHFMSYMDSYFASNIKKFMENLVSFPFSGNAYKLGMITYEINMIHAKELLDFYLNDFFSLLDGIPIILGEFKLVSFSIPILEIENPEDLDEFRMKISRYISSQQLHL